MPVTWVRMYDMHGEKTELRILLLEKGEDGCEYDETEGVGSISKKACFINVKIML
jgi:hypothetical protein